MENLPKRPSSLAEYQIYLQSPHGLIFGVDEVGRGCSWGPMVLAGVVLKPGFFCARIKDSKKLAETSRQTIYSTIMDNSLCVSVFVASTHLIKSFGMTKATQMGIYNCFEQCSQALAKLNKRIDFVLIDAIGVDQSHFFTEPLAPLPQVIVRPKFEDSSISVASASIVAKVFRDKLVKDFASAFGRYSLQSNKGYSTLEHFKALKSYGPSLLHRENFVQSLLSNKNKYNE